MARGVVLIPDGSISGHPLVAVKGDKESCSVRRWIAPTSEAGNAGQCSTNSPARRVRPVTGPTAIFRHCWPARAPGSGSQHAELSGAATTATCISRAVSDTLKKYPLYDSNNNCGPGPVLCSATAVTHNTKQSIVDVGYSITPSVSSGPAPQYQNGLVWGIKRGTYNSGLLAFDAGTMIELYGADQCPTRDEVANPTKFSIPTVAANGYVYVLGTEADFDIFGPTNTACN